MLIKLLHATTSNLQATTPLDILGGGLRGGINCILISSFIRRYKEVLAIDLSPGALQYRDKILFTSIILVKPSSPNYFAPSGA